MTPGWLESHFVARPGGVMTDEVGVITGELTLRTQIDGDGRLVALVCYRDAAEWYAVTGARALAGDAADLDTAHARLVAAFGDAA